MKLRPLKILKKLGPGIITGAADDDPSGIATYSQAGAMYGTNFLWSNVYILPLMFSIQEMSARIGLVTGKGIAKNIREHYSAWLLYFIVGLLVIANTINLGADLGAIAAAVQLLVPINFTLVIILATVLIVVLEVFTSYKQYAKVLKWLALSLFAYIITGFFLNANILDVLEQSLIPHFSFDYAFFFTILGLMGTTISPYLIFWQANQEVEEEMDGRILSRKGGVPNISWKIISKMRLDTWVGMFFSSVTAWFIMLTAASTLFPHGIHEISTAAQAAEALEPLVHAFPNSGYLAKVLFSLGIIGTGLLAVPIFSAGSSYAISEIFGWKAGLNYKVKRAKPFYFIIALSTLIGLLINFIGIDPIQALVYSAVLNGIISVPLIAVILMISNNKKIMGEYKTPLWINAFGILTLVSMGLGAIAMIVTSIVK